MGEGRTRRGESREPHGEVLSLLAVSLSGAVAVALIAALEVVRMPLERMPDLTWPDIFELLSLSARLVVEEGQLALLVAPLAGLYRFLTGAPGLVWRLFTSAMLATLTIAPVRLLILEDPKLAELTPTWLGLGAVGLALVVIYESGLSPSQSRRRRIWRAVLAGLCIIAAVAAIGFDRLAFEDMYETLHRIALLAALIAIQTAVWVRVVDLDRPQSRRAACAVTVLLSIGLFVAVSWSRVEAMPARLEMRLHAHSTIGKRLDFSDLLARRERERCRDIDETMLDTFGFEDADEALEIFEERTHFPELDEGTNLADYNVLLITVDTLREDASSLGPRYRGDRGAFQHLRERGAYTFERAYAPTPSTFPTQTSLVMLRHSSFVPLEVDFHRFWKGTLRENVESVPGLYAESGHRTGAVFHNLTKLDALEETFDWHESVQVYRRENRMTADDRITGRALDFIDNGETDEPFFVWAFLISPHEPYYSNSAEDDTEEAYLRNAVRSEREMREMFEWLDDNDLFDKTIIIATSDHGEEFGEHGGEHHTGTLYEELLRVPLAVYLPGHRGETVERPVSLVHLFPWLLRHGDDRMRRLAVDRIRAEHAPLLEMTDGAVIAELLNPQDRRVAFIYDDEKFIGDIDGVEHELYDLNEDPAEQDNLLRDEPPPKRFDELLERWREVVDCRRRYEYALPG